MRSAKVFQEIADALGTAILLARRGYFKGTAIDLSRKSEFPDCDLDVRGPLSATAGAVALQLGHHQLGVEGGDQILQGLGAALQHLDHALGRDLAG